jgi:hypothetical protein
VKFTFTVLWIVFLAINVNSLQAQTIIDDLQSRSNASDKMIRINCDPSIVALIGKPGKQTSANSNFVERNGFRIQAFMGKATRAEADSKQLAIRTAFPELSTDLLYVAPNFRLLVGDFISREEANACLQRLQKEFPQSGKEMFVVTERIKLYYDR